MLRKLDDPCCDSVVVCLVLIWMREGIRNLDSDSALAVANLSLSDETKYLPSTLHRSVTFGGRFIVHRDLCSDIKSFIC